MLFPVAGSKIYTADSPSPDPDMIPGSGWMEINEPISLGSLGGSFATQTTIYKNKGFAVFKGGFAPNPMQMAFASDTTDAGQAILWKAFRDRRHFPFRLVFPDGVTARSWTGFVISLDEVFDEANSVLALQVQVAVSSQIHRSEEV